MSESPLLTTAEAAAYLRIHRTTLSGLVRNGRIVGITHSDLPGAKLWFHQIDLDAYLEERRRPRPVKRARAPRVIDHERPWLTSA